MIITRTPFRVSFLGGGSDMAAFYQKSVGAVLSTGINASMYLSAHPYFDGSSIHVRYSRAELASCVAEVQHPLVKRALERLKFSGGIEITSTADVPAGTGLGSSSAFLVGLLHLLYAYQGIQVGPGRLAREAAQATLTYFTVAAPLHHQDEELSLLPRNRAVPL